MGDLESLLKSIYNYVVTPDSNITTASSVLQFKLSSIRTAMLDRAGGAQLVVSDSSNLNLFFHPRFGILETLFRMKMDPCKFSRSLHSLLKLLKIVTKRYPVKIKPYSEYILRACRSLLNLNSVDAYTDNVCFIIKFLLETHPSFVGDEPKKIFRVYSNNSVAFKVRRDSYLEVLGTIIIHYTSVLTSSVDNILKKVLVENGNLQFGLLKFYTRVFKTEKLQYGQEIHAKIHSKILKPKIVGKTFQLSTNKLRFICTFINEYKLFLQNDFEAWHGAIRGLLELTERTDFKNRVVSYLELFYNNVMESPIIFKKLLEYFTVKLENDHFSSYDAKCLIYLSKYSVAHTVYDRKFQELLIRRCRLLYSQKIGCLNDLELYCYYLKASCYLATRQDFFFKQNEALITNMTINILMCYGNCPWNQDIILSSIPFILNCMSTTHGDVVKAILQKAWKYSITTKPDFGNYIPLWMYIIRWMSDRVPAPDNDFLTAHDNWNIFNTTMEIILYSLRCNAVKRRLKDKMRLESVLPLNPTILDNITSLLKKMTIQLPKMIFLRWAPQLLVAFIELSQSDLYDTALLNSLSSIGLRMNSVFCKSSQNLSSDPQNQFITYYVDKILRDSLELDHTGDLSYLEVLLEAPRELARQNATLEEYVLPFKVVMANGDNAMASKVMDTLRIWTECIGGDPVKKFTLDLLECRVFNPYERDIKQLLLHSQSNLPLHRALHDKLFIAYEATLLSNFGAFPELNLRSVVPRLVFLAVESTEPNVKQISREILDLLIKSILDRGDFIELYDFFPISVYFAKDETSNLFSSLISYLLDSLLRHRTNSFELAEITIQILMDGCATDGDYCCGALRELLKFDEVLRVNVCYPIIFNKIVNDINSSRDNVRSGSVVTFSCIAKEILADELFFTKYYLRLLKEFVMLLEKFERKAWRVVSKCLAILVSSAENLQSSLNVNVLQPHPTLEEILVQLLKNCLSPHLWSSCQCMKLFDGLCVYLQDVTIADFLLANLSVFNESNFIVDRILKLEEFCSFMTFVNWLGKYGHSLPGTEQKLKSRFVAVLIKFKSDTKEVSSWNCQLMSTFHHQLKLLTSVIGEYVMETPLFSDLICSLLLMPSSLGLLHCDEDFKELMSNGLIDWFSTLKNSPVWPSMMCKIKNLLDERLRLTFDEISSINDEYFTSVEVNELMFCLEFLTNHEYIFLEDLKGFWWDLSRIVDSVCSVLSLYEKRDFTQHNFLTSILETILEFGMSVDSNNFSLLWTFLFVNQSPLSNFIYYSFPDCFAGYFSLYHERFPLQVETALVVSPNLMLLSNLLMTIIKLKGFNTPFVRVVGVELMNNWQKYSNLAVNDSEYFGHFMEIMYWMRQIPELSEILKQLVLDTFNCSQFAIPVHLYPQLGVTNYKDLLSMSAAHLSTYNDELVIVCQLTLCVSSYKDPALVEFLCRCYLHDIERHELIENVLRPVIPTWDSESQIKTIDQIDRLIFSENSDFPAASRIAFTRNIFSEAIIQISGKNVIKNYFLYKLKYIKRVLDEEALTVVKTEEQSVNLTLCFILAEIFFDSFNHEEVESVTQVAVELNQKDFTRDVVLKAYKARSYLDNTGTAELKRLLVCYSLNCVIAACIHLQASAPFFCHFIFQETKETGWKVMNQIVDGQKDYKVSESCILLSESQEVKLDSHESMKSLCRAISEASLENDGEMPPWMISFRNSFSQNKLTLNVRLFSCQLFLKCQNVFTPFVNYFYGPLLLNLIRLDEFLPKFYLSNLFKEMVNLLSLWGEGSVQFTEEIHKSNVLIISVLIQRMYTKDREEAKSKLEVLRKALKRLNDGINTNEETKDTAWIACVRLMYSKDSANIFNGVSVCCELFSSWGLSYSKDTGNQICCRLLAFMDFSTHSKTLELTCKAIGNFLGDTACTGLEPCDRTEYLTRFCRNLRLVNNRNKAEFVVLFLQVQHSISSLNNLFESEFFALVPFLNNPRQLIIHSEIAKIVQGFVRSKTSHDVYKKLLNSGFFKCINSKIGVMRCAVLNALDLFLKENIAELSVCHRVFDKIWETSLLTSPDYKIRFAVYKTLVSYYDLLCRDAPDDPRKQKLVDLMFQGQIDEHFDIQFLAFRFLTKISTPLIDQIVFITGKLGSVPETSPALGNLLRLVLQHYPTSISESEGSVHCLSRCEELILALLTNDHISSVIICFVLFKSVIQSIDPIKLSLIQNDPVIRKRFMSCGLSLDPNIFPCISNETETTLEPPLKKLKSN